MFGCCMRKVKGLDMADITENVGNMVYFSSHHVDIVILQNKVFHAKEQVCRELKCKGTTSYKRFQEFFFFLY